MSTREITSISYSHHSLAGCHRPPPLPFAILDGSPDEETLVTKTRRYYCEPGYVETGPVAVQCNDDLTWITSLDRCKGGSLWKKIYTMSIVILSYGPRREKTYLWGLANNKSADQTVHMCSRISTLFICSLESVICKRASGEISIF